MGNFSKAVYGVFCAASLVFSAPAYTADVASDGAIRHLLMQTFDRPDDRLTVDPVVVVDDRAVAGWSQGEMGGRALLRHVAGKGWLIEFCSGDALKQAETLHHLGASPEQAKALADNLAKAEAALSPARLELLARFEGMVKMDESGAHPPVAHGDHAHDAAQNGHAHKN